MTESIDDRLTVTAEHVRDRSPDWVTVRRRARAGRRRRSAQRVGGGLALIAAAVVAVPIVAGAVRADRPDRVEQTGVAAAPSVDPRPVMSPDTISLPADLPRAFALRAPLPSCGTYKLVQGEQRVPAAGIRCLLAAVGGSKGGELGVSRPSIEGAPIVAWYRAVPDSDRIEVFRDPTADPYRPGQWTYETCAAGRGALEPVRGCAAPQVLVPDAYPPCAAVGLTIYDVLSTSGGAATPEQAAELFAPRNGFHTGGWLVGPERGDTTEVRNARARLSALHGPDGTWQIVQAEHCG